MRSWRPCRWIVFASWEQWSGQASGFWRFEGRRDAFEFVARSLEAGSESVYTAVEVAP